MSVHRNQLLYGKMLVLIDKLVLIDNVYLIISGFFTFFLLYISQIILIVLLLEANNTISLKKIQNL